MKKFLVFIILIIASLAAVYGVKEYRSERNAVDENKYGQKSPAEDGLAKEEPAPPEKKDDPVRKKIKSMTLDEKIGQMIVAGFDGYENDEKIRNLIEDHHIGGIILFKRNIRDADQLLKLINALKESNAKNKIPLFISVDEEGGRVSRMPGELKKVPDNKKIGEVNNREFSFNVGSVIASEIKAFGFNMNFAPVLDINSNPQNPVIGDRSFGTNGKTVSSLGVETMKGIQSQNVIPVIKHFPGHGDTSIDSHMGLPIVNHDMNRLKSFELVPFADAVNNGADAVMVAHILLQEIDPTNPASFSKTFITDVLRKHLGFEGVVITDDMTMGAITKNYSMGNAAVKSVIAGSDIILVCHGYEKEIEVINSLKNAVNIGSISEERIDESVYRILKLKNKYGLTDKSIKSVDVKGINQRVEEVLDKYIKTSS